MSEEELVAALAEMGAEWRERMNQAVFNSTLCCERCEKIFEAEARGYAVANRQLGNLLKKRRKPPGEPASAPPDPPSGPAPA